MIGCNDIGGLCNNMQINTKEMLGQRCCSNDFTDYHVSCSILRCLLGYFVIIVPLLNVYPFPWQILQCLSIQGLTSSGGGSSNAGGDGGAGSSSGASRALVKDRYPF